MDPKIELHLHLEQSVDAATLLTLFAAGVAGAQCDAATRTRLAEIRDSYAWAE